MLLGVVRLYEGFLGTFFLVIVEAWKFAGVLFRNAICEDVVEDCDQFFDVPCVCVCSFRGFSGQGTLILLNCTFASKAAIIQPVDLLSRRSLPASPQELTEKSPTQAGTGAHLPYCNYSVPVHL